MPPKPDLAFIEDVVAEMISHYDVQWHVDGDELEELSLAARDGFLPLWVTLGRNTALAGGLIDSVDDFPIVLDESEDSYFNLCARVGEPSALPRMPHAAAMLLIQDAINEAVRFDPAFMAQNGDNRVNLAPTLNQMEAANVPETGPEHPSQSAIRPE